MLVCNTASWTVDQVVPSVSSFDYIPASNSWTVRPITQSAGSSTSSHQFGTDVALSSDGRRILASDPNGSTGTQVGNGSARLYSTTSSTAAWTAGDWVTGARSAQGDNFGRSIALVGTGTSMVIGAPFSVRSGFSRAGNAYLY